MNFTEQNILDELDLVFKNTAHKIDENTYLNYFFNDLENGYLNIASSKIHLFADNTNWAVVFENVGYHNRAGEAHIELIYIGNCINYERNEAKGRTDLSNYFRIPIIKSSEFQRIENDIGTEMERFELINPNAKSILVRDFEIIIEHNKAEYSTKLIKFRDFENSKQLIGFEDLVRYLVVTEPQLMSATDEEIRANFSLNVPKLMTITSFHQKSIYEPENLPSSYETYQLIAKILTSKNIWDWKPTIAPNNHWSNWVSGNL